MKPRPKDPLDEATCKEQLSLAYVLAVASVAGLAVEFRRVDRHGVDLEILDGQVRIDVQMKGMRAVNAGPMFSFQLDVPTYNKLTDPERSLPGYLMVVETPVEREDWAVATSSGLTVQCRGYYTRLTGMGRSGNASSQVVHMSRDRIITPDSLVHILLDAREGV